MATLSKTVLTSKTAPKPAPVSNQALLLKAAAEEQKLVQEMKAQALVPIQPVPQKAPAPAKVVLQQKAAAVEQEMMRKVQAPLPVKTPAPVYVKAPVPVPVPVQKPAPTPKKVAVTPMAKTSGMVTFGTGTTTATKSVITTKTAAPVLPKILSTGFIRPTPVSVPLELRDAYLKWRSNLEQRMFVGGVADMTADPAMWSRFTNARQRVGLLMDHVGVESTGALRPVIDQWWPHWDADGAAAFDHNVTPGAPPRYGTVYKPQFPRAPVGIAAFVRIQAQRHGATDAVMAPVPQATLDEITGMNLLRAQTSAPPGAGGGGMISSIGTTGTPTRCANPVLPTCPGGGCPRVDMSGAGPTPFVCPGGVYINRDGSIATAAPPDTFSLPPGLDIIPTDPTELRAQLEQLRALLASAQASGAPAQVTAVLANAIALRMQALAQATGLPPSGLEAHVTPRNLLIGGGILGLLWLLFGGKKKR